MQLDQVHYWTYGDKTKPSIVMVHGFTGSHEGFQYIVPKLEKHFYVIVPDLPGFGKSTLPSKPWTIDALAKHTDDFVRSLKLKRKPHLIAHSMGGLVAASMLAQAPELFSDTPVLISPVATKVGALDSRKIGELGGRLQYGVGKMVPILGPRIVKSKHLSKLATNLIMTTKHPDLQKTIHGHHFKNLEYISSIDYYYQLHKDINKRGGVDYAHKLQDFKPLIVAGDKDNVTPLKTEKILANKLNATLKVIPGVGHLAHYEKPTEVAEAIVAFLSR